MEKIDKSLLDEITRLTGRTIEKCGINEVLKICIEELKEKDLELAYATERLEDKFYN